MQQRWKIREPFNGLSHAGGAGLSLVGLVVLATLAWGKPLHLTGVMVYGLSMFLLYCASTLYHSLHVEPHQHRRLLVLDQSAIYLLIAGTYTPICLVSLKGPWGTGLLSVVWGIAVVGILLRVLWKSAPPWLCVVLYVLMGWLCVVALTPLTHALPSHGLKWLFAGGMCYTVGVILFALKQPRLWPGVFSWHEVWHCFVLGGSACHFMVMFLCVAPAP